MLHFLKLLHFSKFRNRFTQRLPRILGEKNYILLLSLAVGFIAGIAAVLLRTIVFKLHHITEQYIHGEWAMWVLPALPAVGIFFCILFVKYWIRGPYEKGLASVIISTGNGTSDVPAQKTYSHIITSGISVGCGVSAGLEAPIALTGSAIGSNVAKIFRLGRESRTLLLACGGAAGVSAVFNSPVAGALFACEILLPEFSIPALIPLLMASATAAMTSSLLSGEQIFHLQVTGWDMGNLPYYILLGLFAGLVSAYTIRCSLNIHHRFKMLNNCWIQGLLGAMILYVVFLFLPMLRSEGYDFVNALFSGNESELLMNSPIRFLFENPWVFLLLIGVLVFLKAMISSVSLASGADGGIFAPSMFIGAFLGFFVARFLRLAGILEPGMESNFIAVGMGGVLAGVMHAPMTGIFLIAEITGGYRLFIPLMIVASLSCYICRKICRYNVYKSTIASQGGTPEPPKETAAMEKVNVEKLVEKDFMPVKQNDTLRTLLTIVMKSKRNIFPVIDNDDHLVGIVTLDNIRPFLLNDSLYDVVLVFDIMADTGPVLNADDSLHDATKLFESCGRWNLPVVKNEKYLGFVSKSGVFDRYRNLLKNKTELF